MNSELLSRIAETLYWTGRYVERADDTARLIDVYVHRMLGESGAGSDAACRALFGILGVPAGTDTELDIGVVLFRLVYDVLQRQPGHEVDRDFLLETLVLRLPQENCEKVFDTFIGWARFGNLFAYDEDSETISLQ